MTIERSESSVLFFIIVFLGFLSVLVISCWRRTSLDFDVAVDRSIYYKNLYAAEIVLNYGIKVSKILFDEFVWHLKKNKIPIELDMSFLLNFDDEFRKLNAFSTFYYNRHGKELVLIAVLKSYEKPIFKLKCTVFKVIENDSEVPSSTRFIIQNYSVCPAV